MSRITRSAILFGLLPASACVKYPDSVTDDDVLDQLVECQSSVAVLQSDLDELTSAVAELQAYDALQDGRLDGHDEEIAGHDAEIAQAVLLLTSSTTVSVSNADELIAALDELDRYRLARDVTYTIELEDGEYVFSEPLSIQHPDGASLQIVGKTGTADAVVLTFASDTDGIVVGQGHALGLLSGVTISGAGATGERTTGVLAENGGSLILGDSMIVKNFWYGVLADHGSSIVGAPSVDVQGWLTLSGCTHCVEADDGSHVTATYTSVTPNGGSGGFVVSRGSSMDASYGIVTGGYQGFVVGEGSSMVAEYASAQGQETTAFQVGQVSYLQAAYAEGSGSTYGLWVEAYGYAYFGYGTLEGDSGSIYQGHNGVADVTNGSISDGVSHGTNDVSDFIFGD